MDNFKSTYEIEEPITRVVEDSNLAETVTTHPAFGQISICRQTGSRSALYGSDFDHQSVISLEITGSELVRNLSNDRHHSRGTKIKIAMSEAQFATLISSLNLGGGVPCTIQRDHTGMVNGLPRPKPRTEQFAAELANAMERAVETTNALEALVEKAGLSKKKADEILREVDGIRRQISGSVTFVADQFDEHMENTIEAAKVEIGGYAAGLAQKMGIATLAGQHSPIALPGVDDA